jgi:oligopeptide/dipeptide ABC transporter ATP-binding protein
LNPEFIVLDEPTSALDSSVQTQILNLLGQIQEELGLSYLFITHNINVVKYMADRIAVMYCGKIVEIGETRAVLTHPLHPYTMALIASSPVPEPSLQGRDVEILGEPPSPVRPPTGCRFHPRCKYAESICSLSEPDLRQLGTEREVACHLAEMIKSRNQGDI